MDIRSAMWDYVQYEHRSRFGYKKQDSITKVFLRLEENRLLQSLPYLGM